MRSRQRTRNATCEPPRGRSKDALGDNPPSSSRRASAGNDATPRGAAVSVILAAILFAAAVIPFLPALRGGFLWDDVAALPENPLLHGLRGLWAIWTTHGQIPNESHYWPMVYTTFWIEHALWGFRAAGYRATNILLHAANTFLIWNILRRSEMRGAFVVALLFAVHPVHVESVAWIIERKDVLSAFFYLLSFRFFIAYDARARFLPGGTPPGTGMTKLTVLSLLTVSVVCFVAAMLSKSMTITLPAAMLLWIWWRRGRIGWKDATAIAPFIVVDAAIGFVDTQLARSEEAVSFGLSVFDRVAVAGRAIWFYLGKCVYPYPLIHIYPRWDPAEWSWVAAIHPAIVAAALVGLWIARRRIGRGPVAASAFFVLTLSPILGLIDFTYMEHSFVADRFLYLACLGPLMLAGAWLWQVPGDLPDVDGYPGPLTVGGRMLAGSLALQFAILTATQANLYRHNETLFRHVVAHNPASHAARNNLGYALMKAGDSRLAELELRDAVRLRPEYGEAWNNLGVLYSGTGKYTAAIEAYREAIRAGAPWTSTRNDLAWLLATSPNAADRSGVEAVALAETAAKTTGRRAAAILDTLAAAYAEAGRFDEAIGTATRAAARARETNQSALAHEIDARLEAYRAGRPWRMTVPAR